LKFASKGDVLRLNPALAGSLSHCDISTWREKKRLDNSGVLKYIEIVFPHRRLSGLGESDSIVCSNQVHPPGVP